MKNLNIYQQADADNPREWDNLGIIASCHPKYNIGDEKIEDEIEFLVYSMLEWDEEKWDLICERNKWSVYDSSWERDAINYLIKHVEKTFVIIPLYIYEHSGIKLSTSPFSCRWDSGQIGYVYVNKDTIRKEYTTKKVTKAIKERVNQTIEAEIETYSQYLEGDVYYFDIVDSEGEVIDSCGGFFGTDWKNNGIYSHVPTEFHNQIEDSEIIYC